MGWRAAAAAAVWASFLGRDRKWCRLAVAATVVALIHAQAETLALEPSPPPGPYLAVALLWAALLLPPTWVLGLAAYVPLAWWLRDAAPDGQGLSLTDFGMFLLVPVVTAAILAGRGRETETQITNMLHGMKQRQANLETDLARKARELELSLEQLAEAQNLESVRTIASGLAHELNNTLTPIRGLAEMLASGQHREHAERFGRRILHSAASAASISEALMTYTRQGAFSPVRTDLCSLLNEEVLPALARGIPLNTQIDTDLAEGTYVSIDRALVRQCVEGVISNAVDAMPNGGTIHVRLETAVSESGSRICRLSIRDEGEGIPRETIDRVFDPFYTTKAAGTARGLGLAMVEGTVTRHGGRVRLVSDRGEGTTVLIDLPLAEGEPVPADCSKESNAPREPVVIVVSGEQDILDVLEELLVGLHCTPVCTRSPEQGIQLARAKQVELIMIDDSIIEGCHELLRLARSESPAIPVVVTVSEPSSPSVRPHDPDGVHSVVRSPLDPDVLSPLVTTLVGGENTLEIGPA